MNKNLKNILAIAALFASSLSIAHHGFNELVAPPVESQVSHGRTATHGNGTNISLKGEKIYQRASNQSSCFVDLIKKVEALAQNTDGRILVGEIENRLGYASGSAGFLVTLHADGPHYLPSSITVTLKSHRERDTQYNVSSHIQLDRNGGCSEDSVVQLFRDLIEQAQNILTIDFYDAGYENNQNHTSSGDVAI